MRLFDFSVSRIDSVFDVDVWKKLDRVFHLPNDIASSGAVHIDKEFRFSGVKGRHADVEAQIEDAGYYSFLMLSVSYGENFIQHACGTQKFLYSPVIWEDDRITPITETDAIAGIFTGDINHDKKTDILVLLTSGAAYLFQQVPGRPPPTTCESKEDD